MIFPPFVGLGFVKSFQEPSLIQSTISKEPAQGLMNQATTFYLYGS
jgi:hypothetical protein